MKNVSNTFVAYTLKKHRDSPTVMKDDFNNFKSKFPEFKLKY